jgi:hypothetical protein
MRQSSSAFLRKAVTFLARDEAKVDEIAKQVQAGLAALPPDRFP